MKLFSGILFLLILLISACKTSTDPYPKNNTIYFNSFESAADTAGWSGYAQLAFRNDSSPNGGKQSLYVSGGCIVPHAEFKIPQQNEDAYYILEGWGKSLLNGGVVLLSIPDANCPGIQFNVSDSVWTFYQSDRKFFCPAGTQLTLTMYSGGIAAAAMLVDQIAVKKVDLSD